MLTTPRALDILFIYQISMILANGLYSAVGCRLILYYMSNMHVVRVWWSLSRFCSSKCSPCNIKWLDICCQCYNDFINNFTSMILICVEIDWLGNRFKMTVLGCILYVVGASIIVIICTLVNPYYELLLFMIL